MTYSVKYDNFFLEQWTNLVHMPFMTPLVTYRIVETVVYYDSYCRIQPWARLHTKILLLCLGQLSLLTSTGC